MIFEKREPQRDRPECKCPIQVGAVIGLFLFIASAANAGEVVEFKPRVSLCRVAMGATAGPRIGERVVLDFERFAENDEFLFAHVLRPGGQTAEMNRRRRDNDELRAEIAEALGKDPKAAEAFLFGKIRDDQATFRHRRNAASFWKALPLNAALAEAIEADIARAYGKMELRSIDPKAFKIEQKEIESEDPLRRVRYLLGEDIGVNTKLFLAYLEGYADLAKVSSGEGKERARRHLLHVMASVEKDVSAHQEPGYLRYVREVAAQSALKASDVTNVREVELFYSERAAKAPEKAAALGLELGRACQVAGVACETSKLLFAGVDSLTKQIRARADRGELSWETRALEGELVQILAKLVRDGQIGEDHPLFPYRRVNELIERAAVADRGPFGRSDWFLVDMNLSVMLLLEKGKSMSEPLEPSRAEALERAIDKLVAFGATQTFVHEDHFGPTNRSTVFSALNNALLVTYETAYRNPRVSTVVNLISGSDQYGPSVREVASRIRMTRE